MTAIRRSLSDLLTRDVTLFVVAFAVRVIARALSAGEQGGYYFFNVIAANVIAGKGFLFDTHFPAYANVMPLYPAFLAALRMLGVGPWGQCALQAAVGAGTVVVARRLAALLFGPRAGIVAGALAAVYPYYVRHDTQLQETVFFTFFTASAVLALYRARGAAPLRRALIAGLLLGLALMTRASLAPFVGAATVWLAWDTLTWGASRGQARRDGYSRSALKAAAVLLGLALTVGPWLVRNERVVGAPVLTTQSGFFLWLAQNEMTFARYPEESIDVTLRDAVRAMTAEETAAYQEASQRGELPRSEWFAAKGRAYMAAHPASVIVGAVRKNVAAFSPIMSPRRPARPLVLAIHALSYTPVLALALLGLGLVAASRRLRDLVPFALLFGTFMVASGIFWAHTSHRVYLDVYLIVLAGHALASAKSLCSRACLRVGT